MRLSALLIILCVFQGCGQKGPLTMPEVESQIPVEQPEFPDPSASSSLHVP